MGWVEELGGKVVAIDTTPLIYFIEQKQPYVDLFRPFFRSVQAGHSSIITSVVTLLEVLVHPIRNCDEALAKEYQDVLLHSANVRTLPVSLATAQVAAELRADTGLKTPDSIPLATALENQATAFLTNDGDFGDAARIQILRLKDLV